MAEAHKRARRNPRYKTQYRVDNWPEYEASLRRRGDISFWVDEAVIQAWTPSKTSKRGGQRRYSDLAIETALTLRLLFHLPLRQTEGFLASLFRLMGLDLPVPDHTTLSRRNQILVLHPRCFDRPAGPVWVIVDSAGLKVCGQGEWHRTKHGAKGRRQWRKLHLAVDEGGFILAQTLTQGHVQDPTEAPALLGRIEGEVHGFVGDGIYDEQGIYEAVLARGRRGGPEPRVVVPPRRNAVLSTDSDQAPTQRDEHIVAIRELGRPRWKRESGYYKQSHAEGAFSRHKRVFGGHLRARHDEARQREAELTCVLLNRMGELGRPESYPVA